MGHLDARVLRSGEFPGFAPQAGTRFSSNAATWAHAPGLSVSRANADEARLTSLGFVAGVREPLSSSDGGNGCGLSIAAQFRAPQGAAGELSHQLQMADGAHGTRFAVSRVPRADGFQLPGPQGPGYNVAFADGDYYYLVGAVGSKAATRANVILAAQHLYVREHR